MRFIRRFALIAFAALALAGTATAGSDPLGLVLSQVNARFPFAAAAGGSGPLTYHGGPVMHSNQTFAIYWIPSGYTVSSAYVSLNNRFLADVAADSGKSSNVYFSDTQYSDKSGPAAYSSSFGGYVVDTNPFPASGCRDSYTSVCLTDRQIQDEIARVAAQRGWTPSASRMFFLYTPRNVGSCYGSMCAFSYFCAYHAAFYRNGLYIYANQPYAAWANCDSGQRPNGSEADPTINVVSHEHNEAITDYRGDAWYDAAGYENGDKCAWRFGSSLGRTSTGSYNQLINGHTYWLQQEWSNQSSACVQTGR